MQRCMQCGAESRDSAKFCERCGKMLSADGGIASQTLASQTHGASSIMDEVVETMAQEPGVRKGWGFRVGILFLLLLVCMVLWWAWQGGKDASGLSENDVQEPVQDMVPARAPSLAEQMGNGVAPVPPNNATAKQDQQTAPSVDASPTPRVTADNNRPRNVEEKKQKVARTEREKAAINTVPSTSRSETSVPLQPLSTAQEVARCEKMSVFARQPCLWRACNNKWGKDGCPAYD